jgi:hypothetical protein
VYILLTYRNSALASLDAEENNEVASPPSEKTSPAVTKSQATDAARATAGDAKAGDA